jgi:hypothetical protein
MTSPYSHPSMPGTPADFPTHITDSPERTPPWHATCPALTADELTADLLAQATHFMTQPLGPLA